MDFASLDVRERLDSVRLPVEAEKPVLLRYDPSLDPILRLGLTGGTDLFRLRLLAEEEVKRALERLEGVAAVLVSGGLEEEIHVELDERRLASLGIGAGLSSAEAGLRLRYEIVPEFAPYVGIEYERAFGDTGSSLSSPQSSCSPRCSAPPRITLCALSRSALMRMKPRASAWS